MEALRKLTSSTAKEKDKDGDKKKETSSKTKQDGQLTREEQAERKDYEHAMKVGMRFACENGTNLDALLINLYSRNVISVHKMDALQKRTMDATAMRELILHISKKSLLVFRRFLEALYETGNDHIAKHIGKKAEQAAARAKDKDAKKKAVKEEKDDDEDDWIVGEGFLAKLDKRSNKKRGKLLSIFVASDDEEEETDEDEKEEQKEKLKREETAKMYATAYQKIEKNRLIGRWRLHPPDWTKMNDDNQYDFLLDYSAYLEICLLLNYYPDRVHSVCRFILDETTQRSAPPRVISGEGQPATADADVDAFERMVAEKAKESDKPRRFFKSVQKFRVSRAVFLQGVSFYGPKNIPTIGYDIQVSIGLNKRGHKIGNIHKIVDAKNGSLVHVQFIWPVPIRPATRHWIKFTIKATNKVVAESKKSKDGKVDYKYGEDGDEDIVQFKFSKSTLSSTCQMPTMEFHRAMEQVYDFSFDQVPPRTFKLRVMDLFPDMTRLLHLTGYQIQNIFFASFHDKDKKEGRVQSWDPVKGVFKETEQTVQNHDEANIPNAILY